MRFNNIYNYWAKSLWRKQFHLCYTFLGSVVCLSVACHIRTPA